MLKIYNKIMNKKKKNIIEKIKELKSSDFIYIGILFVFFIIVCIVFFLSCRFISKNINKILTTPKEEHIEALDVNRYMLVTKKLNINVNIPK